VPVLVWNGRPSLGRSIASDENLVAGNVEPGIETPSAVERSEIAPRIVVPLHWGPWLGVTTGYNRKDHELRGAGDCGKSRH